MYRDAGAAQYNPYAMSNPGLHDTFVYGAEASRAVDAYAIGTLGIEGFELMRRAATFTFGCLRERFPDARSLSVWCGKGNNAGDAYLVTQLAIQAGFEVQVISLEDPDVLKGDAARAFAAAQGAGMKVDGPETAIEGDLIVDGLLGTGVKGAPRGGYLAAIERINTSGLPVVSIDLPSGVVADTGAAAAAVVADLTCSFITRKTGLYTGPGVELAGERRFNELDVPAEAYRAEGVELARFSIAKFPELEANTYKHRQGHVVIAGGDTSMPGAVAMAAEASLRVGAGMVTVITHGQHAGVIVGRTPEIMVLDADDPLVEERLARADLFALGPGLGRDRWGAALYGRVEAASGQLSRPVVLDADGLYLLAGHGEWAGGPLTITPHIAEAARLLDQSSSDVQNNRLAASKALADRFECQGVLKGAGSVVFNKDSLAICGHGNPGMASAGMGDVLTGVVAGLLVQLSCLEKGLEKGFEEGLANRFERLTQAVCLHSLAADVAADRIGQRSLVATDVTQTIPGLLNV